MPKIKKLWKTWVYLSHLSRPSFFQNLKSDIQQIPGVVKILILNMSLLWFGRGIGINMYYSIFLKTIFDNIVIVSVLWSLLALVKLFFSVPIGILDDKINSKNILIVGKILFVLAGLLYFGAGFLGMPVLLILAILAQGLGTPMVFNTNQFLIRRLVPVHLASKTFGMFFSGYQFAYLLAALLTAVLVYFNVSIEYFFLIASGITIFTLLSNTQNKIVDKHGLFYEIKKEALNPGSFKVVRSHLKSHTNGLSIMLFLQSLHGLMYYLWFMFIPLLAVAKEFSLIQIALLFAVMRIPHALTLYLESMISTKKELRFTLISFFVIAGMIAGIALTGSFWIMLGISLVMSFFIATTRPILSGMITRLISTDEQAEITGVQDFVCRIWEIVGYLVFGILAQFTGLSIAFLGVAGGAILLTAYAYQRRKKIIFNDK